jgi:hypothetical protein
MELCSLPHHYIFAYFIAQLLLEAWLGKTSKTKSGSLLELGLRLLLAIPQVIYRGIHGKSL